MTSLTSQGVPGSTRRASLLRVADVGLNLEHMLIRNTTPPAVVSQPAHAWVAGQIARAWGNDRFPRTPLFEDLVFATLQHDIGHLTWEIAPTVDRGTGLPHTYKTLPCRPHLDLWRQGIAWMRPVSRFAALIISMHSAGLYERHFDWVNAPQTDRELIREYIGQQESLQQELIALLGDSPGYEVLRDPDVVDSMALLVGTWDLMSLHVCEAGREPLVLDEVPCVAGSATLRLNRLNPTEEAWQVEPWPFSKPQVELHVDARAIHPPFPSDEALQALLAAVPLHSVSVRFLPAGPVKA